MPEARRLVTGGPYALVRHPLYAGEAVAVAGLAMQYAAPWSYVILGLQYAFQLWRIVNEERVLRAAFPDYAAYAARTARLIPGVYCMIPSGDRFSEKIMLNDAFIPA